MSAVNEVNMAKWIVALRSGKYEQGHRRLHRDGKFCCLGVACDVSGLGQWKPYGDSTKGYLIGGTEVTAMLSPPVSAWLGIGCDDPRLDTDGTTITCTYANDVRAYTFPRIADALESRYLPGKKAEQILAVA